ncbi:MAG: stage V sporulation protein AD [Bacillota bacterium]|nr:stage V sporulation protein AD [Bacillota bacterium]
MTTFRFESRPSLLSMATVAGPDEAKGPLGEKFDQVVPDLWVGQKSWEQAEQELLARAGQTLLVKENLTAADVDLMVGGDLLDQLVTTHFASRTLDIPTFGMFSACATLTASLAVAAMAVDAGYGQKVLVTVASHHHAAERQYRYPVELGIQKPATAQWTATGAAAFLIGKGGPVVVREATPGRVVDYGVKDPFDMGGAMAPAARDTLLRHLQDTGRTVKDYDAIFTGDLAAVGSTLFRDLLKEEGVQVEGIHHDCGLILYDRSSQKAVQAGGSGAACSGLVTAAHIIPGLLSGEWRRVLLLATGALHSPTTYRQGESIPCIAHGVVLERAEAP